MKMTTTFTITRAEYLAFEKLNQEMDKVCGLTIKDSLLPLIDIKTKSLYSALMFKVGLKSEIEVEFTFELTPNFTEDYIAHIRPILLKLVPALKAIAGLSGIDAELKSAARLLYRGFKSTHGEFTTGEAVKVELL